MIILKTLRPAPGGVQEVNAVLLGGQWSCTKDAEFARILNGMLLAPGYYPDSDLERALIAQRAYGGEVVDRRSQKALVGEVF